MFESAREGGSTIFVAGNGGSSTTATTMANDIGFDILKKTGIDRAFRVLSLVDNNAVVTAIANDVGYENIFINQLKIHYRAGYSIILISASGNSPNIIAVAAAFGFSLVLLLPSCGINIFFSFFFSHAHCPCRKL